MNKFKYIDVSGVGNSGKSALVDLLREYEDKIWAPHFQFEFDLLRVPGGLFDLRYGLVENWSHIRSNYAYMRFQKVAAKMGGNGKRKSLIDLACNYGTSYQIFFNHKFHEYTDQFLKNFVVGKYDAFWPYDMLDDNFLIRFFKKFCLKFKLQKSLLSNVSLFNGDNFDHLAHIYIDNLFREVMGAKDKGDRSIILNNSFEPYNPEVGLNIFEGSRSIIVVRDPRDIYVSGKNVFSMKEEDKKLMASDNDGVNKSFLGADDLNIYIARMNLYLSNITKSGDRIKIIKFENLILKFEETKKEIEDFLGFHSRDHLLPNKFLKTSESAKNIGKWKLYSNQDEIKYMEEQMKSHSWVFHNE